MLRLEAELDDTAAVAIVHDCGVDADRLRVIGTRFYAEEEERRHDRG
jgi:hypothetical protein